MRTLLSLFFVPYLRFLAKFHLYVLGIAALILVLRIKELMMLAPMLYMFSLYMTSNRHQFKDNISWMLSTFNKKTLLKYHFIAQAMVLLTQAFASLIFIVAYFSIMFLVSPESSDQILPDFASKPTTGAGAMLTKGMSPLASTKEQLVLAAVGIFFLITMFSPVSLKDYLRSVETDTKQASVKEWLVMGVVFFVAMTLILYVNPAHWLVVVMSIVLTTELLYFFYIFNKAFVLVPKKIETYGYYASLGFAFVLGFGIYQLSLGRFHKAKLAEEKFTEYVFLGAMAPKISDADFSKWSSEIKDPSFIADMLEEERFKLLVKPEQLVTWAQNSKELSGAFRLLKHMPANDMAWLENRELWTHLEKLGLELAKTNPTLAFWQVKRFEAHLLQNKWKPPYSESFTERGPVEQALLLGAWYKNNPHEHALAVKLGVKPEAQAFMNPGDSKRVPASDSKQL
jgi:hypothetical protein